MAGVDFDAVDVAVGDGHDVTGVDVLDFGGVEIDGEDAAVDAVIVNEVTDVVVTVADDLEAADDVFQGILEGEADDDAGNTNTSKHRRNVDAKALKNDEDDNHSNGSADDATEHPKVGLAAFSGEVSGLEFLLHIYIIA